MSDATVQESASAIHSRIKYFTLVYKFMSIEAVKK